MKCFICTKENATGNLVTYRDDGSEIDTIVPCCKVCGIECGEDEFEEEWGDGWYQQYEELDCIYVDLAHYQRSEKEK